jgi:hypothetical protein
MADNARKQHVSPGIYTREIDINYAVRSLGITTLGVAGETLKGPAFQPMDIANWREFQDVFGGTSTEKFKGSQYPKYELPYIAKSFLSESEQLKVVRVLGLSGYNAGPAWVVTASKGGSGKQAVAVIRSRGTYRPYVASNSEDSCACNPTKYDTLKYYVGEQPLTQANGCEKEGYNGKALSIDNYTSFYSYSDECTKYTISGTPEGFSITQADHGRFKLVGYTGEYSGGTDISKVSENDKFEYSVSLNPFDKDYILNVLGTTPDDNDAPIYVESLYDVALDQGISDGYLTQIDNKLTFYQVYYTADYCHHEPVLGLLTIPQESLTRKRVGERYLADANAVEQQIQCVKYDYGTNKPMLVSGDVETEVVTIGQIYTVKQYTTSDGKRHYYYTYYDPTTVTAAFSGDTEAAINYYGNLKGGGNSGSTAQGATLVLNMSDGLYYKYREKDETSVVTAIEDNEEAPFKFKSKNTDDYKYSYEWSDGVVSVYTEKRNPSVGDTLVSDMLKETPAGTVGKVTTEVTIIPADVEFVQLDLNDYKSSYRYASTPWIVSNLKGDFNKIEVNKLFRFHTISDGDGSNNEVKISIENIRPDDGVFDVVVRRIDDTDESIIPLERFTRCSMVPSDSNYIAYKIGSFDGLYETKSKYITVEVNDSTAAQMSVPCGFLGYPIPKYDGVQIGDAETVDVKFPTLKYNRYYDPEIKNRKQYFGLSSWVGVDIDTFTFKGSKAYIETPSFVSNGFHLDSRLDNETTNVTVDGESGYKFDVVSTNSRTSTLSNPPVIDTEDNMYGSIFENVNLRKFTVYFYGGFDGWDVYRDQRTNTDGYKLSQYKGYVNQGSGEGYSFNRIKDSDALKLNQNGITSDWYAYLSGIRQFSNPEETDINILATPGIDYVNQKLLVEEAIEMVEEERADSIYVVTTPDKPSGSGDYVDEMYTPEEAVYNLEDSDIDSNYSCTYYPWVKYLDTDNSQYIYLPPTKDAVRNFAQTDNQAYPWYAPAGLNRGNVDCVRAHFTTKIGDEDTLYEGRINPIKTFARDGVKIWGQKNLQVNESQLNRIAVRRLLLRLRKLIAISCLGLIFEPNDPTTKQSFISLVTPILESIRNNRGISDFRIEVNDSVESRQNRELPVKIYIKPYQALEYITIDFIVTNEGVSFDDI